MNSMLAMALAGCLHPPWPEDAVRHVVDCPELIVDQGDTGHLDLTTNVQSGDAVVVTSVGDVGIVPPTGALIIRDSNAAGYPSTTAFYKLSDTDVQNGYIEIEADAGTSGQIATVYGQLFRNASANQPDIAPPSPATATGTSPLVVTPGSQTTITDNSFVLQIHRAAIGGTSVDFASAAFFGGLYRKTTLPQMMPTGNLQQASGPSSTATSTWTWSGGGSYSADVEVIALRPSVILVDFQTTQATDTLTLNSQGGSGTTTQTGGFYVLTPQASTVNSQVVRCGGRWLWVEAVCSVAKPSGNLQFLTLGLGTGALRGAIGATAWNYTCFTNGYVVGLTSTTGLTLYKHVSGTRTSLGTGTLTGSDVFNDGVQNTIRLAIESGHVKVYVNGTAYIDATDSTYTAGTALIAQGGDASNNGGVLSIARLTVKSD